MSLYMHPYLLYIYIIVYMYYCATILCKFMPVSPAVTFIYFYTINIILHTMCALWVQLSIFLYHCFLAACDS